MVSFKSYPELPKHNSLESIENFFKKIPLFLFRMLPTAAGGPSLFFGRLPGFARLPFW